MNKIKLYNKLTENQRKLVDKSIEGQTSRNINLYKALVTLGLIKSEENFVKFDELSIEEREDLKVVETYLRAVDKDKEDRNYYFCEDYSDDIEEIQEKIHDMIQEGTDIDIIKDWALKQEKEVVKILAERHGFSEEEARQFTGKVKFNFKTDDEIERDRKHEIVEEVYEDYFEHQSKLQENDYSSIYWLVEVLEENWNSCGADLEYDLDIKDDYLYLESTKICPMDQLICCEAQGDAVKYQLKNEKFLYITIQWVAGNDAFINQIYIQGENEEDCEILYEKE